MISDNGVAHKSTIELVGMLVGEKNARHLYSGKLASLFQEQTSDSASQKLGAARELVKRWMYEELEAKTIFQSPEVVKDFLKIHFAGRDYESFVVLFLDCQHRLIRAEELFRGTLTQTSVYPREIVKIALKRNAASVIFAHNHPSGLATPSRADEALTHTLKAALSLVDVRIVDHFVVAPPNITSFAETGLL